MHGGDNEDFVIAKDRSKPDEVHTAYHFGGNAHYKALLLRRTCKR
jgi:hypothetical protein